MKSQTILALDPGLSKMGWALLELKKKKINVLKVGTIETKKVTTRVAYKRLNQKYGNRIITLLKLEKNLFKIMQEYQPDHFAIEDAFFNSRFASAFSALVQVMLVTTRLVFKLFHKTVHKIPTKSAKKALCGHGGDSKAPIKKAIQKNKNIKLNITVDELTEHEADAIAVGYGFIQLILPTLT